MFLFLMAREVWYILSLNLLLTYTLASVLTRLADKLKQRVIDVWSGMHLNIVDTAVSEWKKHRNNRQMGQQIYVFYFPTVKEHK